MLVPVRADEVDALSRGAAGGRPIAPGWPHEGTAIGLGYVRRGGVGFLILDDDGRIAGECGTKAPSRADGSVEIGYGLAAASRGHGLGGRAVAELVEQLGARPDVRSIDAEIHVSNTASRRLVERLGFETDGTVHDGYLVYRRATRPVRQTADK